MRPTLDELGIKHGCDKASQVETGWMRAQNYLRFYEPLFEPLRDEPITLLELGWGEWDPVHRNHADPNNGGRSARMWRDYFTDARIAIVEIEAKNNTVDGVDLYRGSQDDPDFLVQVLETIGPPDIIIDDASHIGSLTIRSFELLWPWLKPGGYYIIEEIGDSSFHPWFWGANEANQDPDQPCRNGNPTVQQFFKKLADDVHYRGTRLHGPDPRALTTDWDLYPAKYWHGYAVESVFFAFNLVIVAKRRHSK